MKITIEIQEVYGTFLGDRKIRATWHCSQCRWGAGYFLDLESNVEWDVQQHISMCDEAYWGDLMGDL